MKEKNNFLFKKKYITIYKIFFYIIMNRFILKKITQIKKKYINNIYIFLLKFGLKVSLSQLCLCARFRASWVRKSRDGLALKKSTRPRPLPDYKDFGHYWWDFLGNRRLTTFIDKAPFLPSVGAHKLHDLAWVLASKVESWEFFC